MAFKYISDDYGKSYACDGICFDSDRVKSEIFALQGAFRQCLSEDFQNNDAEKMLVLKEISRSMSTLSLYSRMQMTSYFQRMHKEIPLREKITLLKKNRVIASRAIGTSVGYTQKTLSVKAKVLSFYDAIGQIVHVEKWRHPVSIPADKINLFADEVNQENNNWLLIEITKRGCTPVTGAVEYSYIEVPAFAEAAYQFVSDCHDCMQIFEDESENVDSVVV